MSKNRIFRFLICFLAIFCLFCNYAALPSRAFGFAEAAIPAMALILMYLIMQTGFIPPPDITISNLENVDNAFRNWYGDFDISFRNPDDPWPDDLDDEESDLSDQLDAIKDAINNGAEEDLNQTLKISEELMNAFRLYIAFCIGENAISLPGEAAPEGSVYFGGELYPEFPASCYDNTPYMFIYGNSSTGVITLTYAENPLYVAYRDSYGYYYKAPGGTLACSYQLTDSGWGDYIASSFGFISEKYDTYLIASGFDIEPLDGNLGVSASIPLTQEEAYLEAVAILGETAQGIQDGTKTEDDLVIPQYVNVSELFANAASADDMMQNYNQIAQELQDGTRDYNDFAQSVVAANPSTGDNVNDNTGSDSVTDDSLANYPVLDFFSKLGELLEAISSGNISEIGNILQDRVMEIRGDIDGVNSTLQEGFQDVVDSNQSLNDSVQDFAEQQNQMMQEQNQVIEDQAQTLGDRLLNGVQSLFVPSDGFIEGKVDNLRNDYAFADSIALTAVDLRNFLTNLGSVPPVIRINLGAATGSFNWGGDMVLIDFSFYDPYKPTMDAILSAFLWLWFCWRVILGLPGIIGGASGLSGAFHDSSQVGSRGYISTSNSNAGVTSASQSERPKFVPRPGGDTHYKIWRENHK